MSDKNKVVLERLRKLIDTATREEIARGLECNTSTVTKHYNNDRPVTLDYVVKYAKYFGVSTDYLLGLTNAKTTNNPGFRTVSDYLSLTDEATENLEFICDSKVFGIVDTETYMFDNENYIERMLKYNVRITPNQVANAFFSSEYAKDLFDEIQSKLFINTVDSLDLKEQVDKVERLQKKLFENGFNEDLFSETHKELSKGLTLASKIKKNIKIDAVDLFDTLREIIVDVIQYPDDSIKRIRELERDMYYGNHKKEK